MRLRRRDAAAELPVEFQLFTLAAWVDYIDLHDDAERLARARWNAARMAWGRANGWSPLEVLRRGVNARRVADGQAPIDYEVNTHNRRSAP